jgi:hypothetical protein
LTALVAPYSAEKQSQAQATRAGFTGQNTRSLKATSLEEVFELLRSYPKWRYQGLVLQQVLGVYVSLRGHLTDTLREINFCRVRLAELAQVFEQGLTGIGQKTGAAASLLTPDPWSLTGTVPGRNLFPDGCADLEQAVGRAEANTGEAELLQLDGRIQKMIKAQFVALVQVCLSSKNVTRNVAQAMRAEAEAFFAERLAKADVARLFLQQHPNSEEQAHNEIIGLYEEAVPEPSRTAQARAIAAQAEVTVLLAPAGTDGDSLRRLARVALPETSLVTEAQGEDVILYREWSNLALTDLEHLGPLGQEAYRQLLASDCTPHARQDIEFELPL